MGRPLPVDPASQAQGPPPPASPSYIQPPSPRFSPLDDLIDTSTPVSTTYSWNASAPTRAVWTPPRVISPLPTGAARGQTNDNAPQSVDHDSEVEADRGRILAGLELHEPSPNSAPGPFSSAAAAEQLALDRRNAAQILGYDAVESPQTVDTFLRIFSPVRSTESQSSTEAPVVLRQTGVETAGEGVTEREDNSPFRSLNFARLQQAEETRRREVQREEGRGSGGVDALGSRSDGAGVGTGLSSLFALSRDSEAPLELHPRPRPSPQVQPRSQGRRSLGSRTRAATGGGGGGSNRLELSPEARAEFERVLRGAREALRGAVEFAERLDRLRLELQAISESRSSSSSSSLSLDPRSAAITISTARRLRLAELLRPSFGSSFSPPPSFASLAEASTSTSAVQDAEQGQGELRAFPGELATATLERSISNLRQAGGRVEALIRQLGGGGEDAQEGNHDDHGEDSMLDLRERLGRRRAQRERERERETALLLASSARAPQSRPARTTLPPYRPPPIVFRASPPSSHAESDPAQAPSQSQTQSSSHSFGLISPDLIEAYTSSSSASATPAPLPASSITPPRSLSNSRRTSPPSPSPTQPQLAAAGGFLPLSLRLGDGARLAPLQFPAPQSQSPDRPVGQINDESETRGRGMRSLTLPLGRDVSGASRRVHNFDPSDDDPVIIEFDELGGGTGPPPLPARTHQPSRAGAGEGLRRMGFPIKLDRNGVEIRDDGAFLEEGARGRGRERCGR